MPSTEVEVEYCFTSYQLIYGYIRMDDDNDDEIAIHWICMLSLLYICRDEYESDGSLDDDEESRPMTRNELTSKAMKSVKKRESAMRRQVDHYDLSDAREKTKKKGKK